MIASIRKNLSEIQDLISSLLLAQYSQKLDVLSGASIGQHVRHILEFYLCLVKTPPLVPICYDERARDTRIETDPAFAHEVVDYLLQQLELIREDRALSLKADFSARSSPAQQLSSSLYRELAYALEHSIHHQALIKIGLGQLTPPYAVSASFGVAPSTLRNQAKVCAQ